MGIQSLRLGSAHFLDILESLMPVNMWLSGTEEIEIWAVDDKNEFLSVPHDQIYSVFRKE